jgi:hypothetical protein
LLARFLTDDSVEFAHHPWVWVRSHH